MWFRRQPSDRSLAQAKSNVEKYFLVVGLTDKIQEFFSALELLLPRYFRSLSQLYQFHTTQSNYFYCIAFIFVLLAVIK